VERAVGKQRRRSCRILGEGAVTFLEKTTPLAVAAESVASYLGWGWGEARAVFGKISY
jgi:hypothetical protein